MQAGKHFYREPDKFKQAIKALPDGFYTIVIEQTGNIRSIKQNNSMWGIAYQYYKKALTDTGQYKYISNKQVHDWCMHHCLPEDYKERILKEWQDDPGMIDLKTGEVFKSAFRLTTTKMTRVDAMHYYDNLQAFYSEWFSSGQEGDTIPDPDINWKKKKEINAGGME